MFLSLLLVTLPVTQESRAEEIVRNAILASGGGDLLARFPAGQLTAKGFFYQGVNEYAVATEQLYWYPSRSKTLIRTEIKGRMQEVLQVVDGLKIKVVVDSIAIPMTPTLARSIQQAELYSEMGQLLPLLNEKRFSLKLDPSARSAEISIVVKGKGIPEVKLGFDRATNHLLRLTHRAVDPETGEEVIWEQLLSDHKSFKGLIRPTKSILYKDGVRLIELTTEKFTPLEKADPKDFAVEG